MALTLGDVLIMFRGDTSGIDRSMQQTESAATSWGQRLSGSIKNVLEVAAGGLLANAGSRLAGMANNTLRTGFELVKNYELQVQSLQSLAARELLNTGQAKDMNDALAKGRVIGEASIAWVEKLAIKSPFSSQDIIGAYQIGSALGFTSDNLKVLIQDTTDWASASGKGKEEMMGVFTALGQMNISGRANYQEMLSLVVRGVPVWDYMSKAMGKPVSEIQKLMSQGLLPASVAIKAVSDGMHHDFGGAAERMANSLAGLTGSLQDLASITLRNLFQPALQAIQPYLAKMVETIADPALQAGVKAVGAAIGVVLVGALKRLAGMIVPVTNFAARVVAGFQLLKVVFTGIVGPWQSGANIIVAITNGLWGRITSVFASAKSRAAAWGGGVIQQYASGMIAAIHIIIDAVKAIGSVLSFWLKPNSPPKVAPDIDTWGEQTGEQYGKGIGRANIGKHIASFGERLRDQLAAQFEGLSAEDMGLVETLQGTIGGVLDSISKAGGMKEGAATGIKQGLTAPLVAAIRELKETGKVSDETFKKLKSAAGPAGPAIEKITHAYFDLTVATKKVSKAQQELTDIEQRYQKLTKPVDDQLDAVGKQRAQIADQKRLMALQAVMMDASTDGADRADAALEIQEIQLSGQKRALEGQQKAETDVAQLKLDAAAKEAAAAEERVKREEESLKLYGAQADLSKQILDATKAAGAGQAKALNLVRNEVKGITDAVTEAKDTAISFAEQIKTSGDNAVARAKAFREQVVAAWAMFTSNPLVAGLIKLGTAVATFIEKNWKPLLGAIVGGAAAWAAPGLLVPIFGFIRIVKLIGVGVVALGGPLSALRIALLSLFTPFNMIIVLGALLGAAWGSNFANIQRLTPELTKLGALFKGVIKALLGGDIKGAMGFLGPISKELSTIRGKVFDWIKEAVPLLIEKMKPWAAALGSWVTTTALPWLWQGLRDLVSWLLNYIKDAAPPILAQLAVWGRMFGDWIWTKALPWLGIQALLLLDWLYDWISGNGPGILAQLGIWARAFGDWMSGTALPWLGTKAGELITWLYNWIVANGPGILAQLGVWARAFGDWLGTTALPWLGQKANELIAWLSAWIVANGPGILAQLGIWAQAFGDWMSTTALPWLELKANELIAWLIAWVVANGPLIAEQLLVWADMFGDWIVQTALPWLGQKIAELGQWLTDWIIAYGPGLLSMLGTWAVKFAEWVPIGIALLIVALGLLLGKLLGWIIENGPSILTTLQTWLDQFVTWNANVIAWLLTTALPNMLAWITNDLGPGMVTGLGTMFGIIGTTIADLWSAAWAPGTLGETLLTNLKAALDGIWPSLKAYFGGLLNSLNPWGAPAAPTTTTTGGAGTNGTGAPSSAGGAGGGGRKDGVPGFAVGVQNFAGGLALVGEEGPELVELPTGTNVIPAPATADAIRAASGRGAGANNAQAHLHLSIQNPVVDSQARLSELIEQIRATVSGDLERLITQITLDTL